MAAGKSSRINRQYKTKYRIRNWREYERGLRSRGDVTLWLSEDAIAGWIPPKNGLRGGHRLPAIKAGIGPRQDFLHAARQSPESALEMGGDLAARGPVAVAQPAHQVFARLGRESQYRLVAALAFVLGVVTLAPAHLAAVERVHGGVGVQRHRLQFHLGRGPDSFPQLALDGEDLLRHVQMQRDQKAPQRGLRRQTGHLQDAGQDGVASAMKRSWWSRAKPT